MNAKELNDLSAAGEAPEAAAYSPEKKEELGAAAQRVGMRAANVTTASKVFDQEMPEIVLLRHKVQKKGMLPSSGLQDINAFNQWMGAKISDADTVELRKKTKLLADTLQRTVGGTEGGQWAFEVAADILDPRYSPEAFERIMTSHSKTLKRKSGNFKAPPAGPFADRWAAT